MHLICRKKKKQNIGQGFPNGVDFLGGQFWENDEKLHENYKINILGAKH